MTFRTLIGPRDPRVYSGLLARKTLKQLKERPDEVANDPVALVILNFVRLLEMYRYNVMRRHPTPAGILESVPLVFGAKTIDDVGGDPLKDVEHAFEEARKQVFTNPVLDREAAANKVRATLAWHLQDPCENPQRPPVEDIHKTVDFLDKFLETLAAKPA